MPRTDSPSLSADATSFDHVRRVGGRRLEFGRHFGGGGHREIDIHAIRGHQVSHEAGIGVEGSFPACDLPFL
jgi:hypothetical protein